MLPCNPCNYRILRTYDVAKYFYIAAASCAHFRNERPGRGTYVFRAFRNPQRRVEIFSVFTVSYLSLIIENKTFFTVVFPKLPVIAIFMRQSFPASSFLVFLTYRRLFNLSNGFRIALAIAVAKTAAHGAHTAYNKNR